MSEIIRNLSDKDYNEMPALRATILKELTKSPLHAKYLMDNVKPATPALIFGRWLHSYLLDGADFQKKHHLLDCKLNLRTTADKEKKAKLAEAWGENIIDLEDWQKLQDMKKAALSNPSVATLLKAVSDTELTLKWTEKKIECKARLDAYSKQLSAIIDIKSCQDASKEGFSKQISNFKYHLQASHYLEGAKSCGLLAHSFIFIAIEKEPPYASASYLLELGSLGTAHAQREDLLTLFHKCSTKNSWAGYSNKVEDIGLPEWASAKIEKSFLEDKNYE